MGVFTTFQELLCNFLETPDKFLKVTKTFANFEELLNNF